MTQVYDSFHIILQKVQIKAFLLAITRLFVFWVILVGKSWSPLEKPSKNSAAASFEEIR